MTPTEKVALTAAAAVAGIALIAWLAERKPSPEEVVVKLLRRGEHTDGVSETCEYAGTCREPSAGELRAHSAAHKLPWGCCAEHVKPEHHPADLRDRLFRW